MSTATARSSPITPAAESSPTVTLLVPTIAPAAIAPTPTSRSSGEGGSKTVAVSIVEPPFKPPATWKFAPAAITVTIGTKITWTNTGAVAHTATAQDSKLFDSGDVGPKASFSYTPVSAGRTAYICTYHPWMTGTITILP
jgi:plastocyanin